MKIPFQTEPKVIETETMPNTELLNAESNRWKEVIKQSENEQLLQNKLERTEPKVIRPTEDTTQHFPFPKDECEQSSNAESELWNKKMQSEDKQKLGAGSLRHSDAMEESCKKFPKVIEELINTTREPEDYEEGSSKKNQQGYPNGSEEIIGEY